MRAASLPPFLLQMPETAEMESVLETTRNNRIW